MPPLKIARIPSIRSLGQFREVVATLGIDLQAEDRIEVGAGSPLTQGLNWQGRSIGNRWTIHPMEGWDGTTSGGATEPMRRRWERFGLSGAKLIWGGEAMAVRPDGRANPNQLILMESNLADIAELREGLLRTHLARYGNTGDLVIGFQLTHSGRFCRPNDKKRPEPRVAFRHPLLDRRFQVTSDDQLFADDELKHLVEDYIRAAKLAQRAGADFVDIKHCHGYLLHELLGAHNRPGPYGGSFENRTRMFRDIVAGIKAEVPGLGLGVRLSAFDIVPFKPDPTAAEPGRLGRGIPEDFSACLPYTYGFGVNQQNPVEPDLAETRLFLALCRSLGVRLVNLSAGSPYYNPHIGRPNAYPPSDGYQTPEDPLVGCARQIQMVKELKADFPDLLLVGTAYSYLQEFLPQVAQFYLRHGHVDSVGIGRSVLSYPEMLVDATTTGTLQPRRICRTFSDCTNGPRNGLPSGCYPLDPYYKALPAAEALKALKGGKV